MNLNVETNVEKFRLITEGYILVSDEMTDKESTILTCLLKGLGWTAGNIWQHFPDLCILYEKENLSPFDVSPGIVRYSLHPDESHHIWNSQHLPEVGWAGLGGGR